MKVIYGVTLIFLLIAFSIAENECNYKGHMFTVGENYAPIGECAMYTCQEGGGVIGKTCALEAGPPHCKFIDQDNNKPYPECCSQILCP